MSDNERRMSRSGLIITCLAAALGFASALALASCGGSDAKLLSGTTADEINSNLARVRELAAEGECVGAEDAALEVSGQVSDLRGIDPKLKAALQEGATRLNEVVDACSEEATATEETEEPEPTTTTEAPPTKEQQKEEEKQQKEEEKLQKDAEKQEEQEQKDAEKQEEQEQKELEAEEKAQEKEAKGHEEHGPPPPAAPSGGVGPGGEAGD
jgi:flagellar biosynthesis GTPase FlhF